MGRLVDIRQTVHQPFWDHVCRTIGVTTVPNLVTLFGQNAGQRSLTNMPTAGALSSDKTYLIRAIRCIMLFKSLTDEVYTTTYGGLTALANVSATNARAEDLYSLVAYGAYFTLEVGDKAQISAPLWYAPAGGGLVGATTASDRHELTNGLATHEAILRLAKSITIAVRQGFNIRIEFFPFARSATFGTGNGASGSAIGTDIDPLAVFNAFDGLKSLSLGVDGVKKAFRRLGEILTDFMAPSHCEV